MMEEAGEPYKVELIEDLPEDAELSFYKQGEFTEEESRQIKQLEIQIQHLYQASAQWTVADTNNCQKIGFSI